MSPPGIYGPISFGPWIPAPNISTRRAFKNWKHMGLYKLNPPQWNQKLAHFVQILLRNLHILCDHLSRDQSKYRSNHIDLEIFVTDFYWNISPRRLSHPRLTLADPLEIHGPRFFSTRGSLPLTLEYVQPLYCS